jgi:hypothetical protein
MTAELDQPAAPPIPELAEVYTQALIAVTRIGLGAGAERTGACGRSHPAASQLRGTENSLQPQSRQMRTSGDGVKGGWLRVRGRFR